MKIASLKKGINYEKVISNIIHEKISNNLLRKWLIYIYFFEFN